MLQNVLVYWIGIIGVPGKGPNWVENYVPNTTIGEILQNMKKHKLDDNKRIEMLKFERGDINKYDKNDPYWKHDATLLEYANKMGAHSYKDLQLIYVII